MVRRRAGRFALGVGAVYLTLRLLSLGEDGSGPHTFLHTGSAGQPIAYPCGPIHYTVSTQHAPDDFEQVVHGAVGMVSAASGYTFAYDGPTTDRDFYAHLVAGRAGPVLIGFAGSGEVPGLAGDVAGRAASAPAGDGAHYSTGVIMLDAAYYAQGEDLAQRQAIVQHELGHVLGLGHVRDGGELMNEDNTGRTGFGPGDLAGLRALHQASCPKAG